VPAGDEAGPGALAEPQAAIRPATAAMTAVNAARRPAAEEIVGMCCHLIVAEWWR
jgi:hypothetical protein